MIYNHHNTNIRLLLFCKMRLYLFFFFSFSCLQCSVALTSKDIAYDIDGSKVFKFDTLPTHKSIDIKPFESSTSDIIVVKDLAGNNIRVVDDILAECYDVDDCEYSLTEYDRNMLTMYASFIDNCGIGVVSDSYSLGLIRDKNYPNVMGMYSIGRSDFKNKYAFWIRLYRNDGTKIWDHDTETSLAMAILELAVHERSHYDVANTVDAHGNSFQTNYNTLFHRSLRNLKYYESFTHRVLVPDDMLSYTSGILMVVFFLVVLTLIWAYVAGS